MIEAIVQAAILIFGMTGIFLVNHPNPNVAKYGCLFGCAAQPFWFYMSFDAAQWGVFLGTFVYCASWVRGVYNNWWIPWQKKRTTNSSSSTRTTASST